MVHDELEPEKLNELCSDYAKVLKIDISKDVSSTSEIIEETLTRLEEFQSIIAMVQGECGEKQVESLLVHKKELAAMGDMIDRLQALVATVTQTVNEVETCVMNAEMDLASNKSTIRNLFKPFFKKNESTTSEDPYSKYIPPFKAPEIFKTSDFFPCAEEGGE